jgi:Cu/Zn superoxide dismutase
VRIAAAVAIALVASTAACGGSDESNETTEPPTQTRPAANVPSAESTKVRIALRAQSGSGESGTARLTRAGAGKTVVLVQLDNAPKEAQPAHIHRGTCDELDPTPAYPLADVKNGRSRSEVNASLQTLLRDSYAINVHKSAAEAKTYVACGEIRSSAG